MIGAGSFQVTSQNRKNSNTPDKITCQTNPKPGPVNKIAILQVSRIRKARIIRVRLEKMGFTVFSSLSLPCMGTGEC